MNGIVPIPAQRALEIDERIRQIDYEEKRGFIETGFLLVETDQKDLWKYLCDENGVAFRSMDDYMTRGIPCSRSKAYAAKRIVEAYRGRIPREELEMIPTTNFKLLDKLPSSAIRKWIPVAQSMGHDDLRDKIRKELPDLHLENSWRMVFNFEESQYLAVEQKIKAAMRNHGLLSREQAMENIAAWYEPEKDRGEQ